MPDKCPICDRDLKKLERRSDFSYFECGYCGPYCLTSEAESLVRGEFTSGHPQVPRRKAVLSHAIRRVYEPGNWVKIDSGNVERLIKEGWLPSLPEQANNLIRWMGDTLIPGHRTDLDPEDCQPIIGAETVENASFIFQHLYNRGLVEGVVSEAINREAQILEARLTMAGWERYEDLQRGAVDSRKAFMAMKYGDRELDAVFARFKVAISQTGFDLVRLDQRPAAGLIDDKMRVEILTSRFLISDLTHGNAGAYWEAGYAEGLGKPVIYTCRGNAFKDQAHFDTNHHLTVMWDPAKLDQAASELKATIRATLPTEAMMSD